MANDIAGVDLQKSSPCIALTKNDSYVMSACGGKVSVFNALTYGVYMFYVYKLCNSSLYINVSYP